MQRRIDALLDEADAAIGRREWAEAIELARDVLTLDETNADATALIALAERRSGSASSAASSTPQSTSTDTATPQLPDSFVGGRYRVERFLGEGGKKRVFLAHDTTLDRDVAFGQFRTEGMDAAGRARVTQEAQAMGRVGAHANLVGIHDIGEESGAPFIVQEYVSGGSLADLAGDGPLPLERTLRLAQDVCAALSFIHDQNLVHRDIKPSNVFLTDEGSAKVGDFGLAVGLDRTRITMQGGMIGTPSYMPPEQALAGDVTPQSDLYSLGAMLYELVTGRPPFVGDDPTSVISQHINTPPVAPSWHSEHCPPSLEALILSLLEKDPSKRPASATEVATALARVDPDEGSARHSGSGDNPLEGLARGVFVGRESELERLRTAFDEAFAGRGSVVMLVGEPGIGKTRTTQELETYARMRGARVLWGRAHEASGAPAYWPWIQVGNHHARFVPPPELADDLDQSQVDELGRIFPALQAANPQPITDPAAAQFRLFDAYTAFMRAGSERAPLVIVLDDLHWADAPSLLLLQHMARELPRMRILVIGTFRDTDLTRTHPLSNALAELNREGGTQRVVLRGLSESEVGAYIRAVAGTEPLPALVGRIYEETEGNPFFLSEVVNLMAQEGGFGGGADVVIPDGVREAIGRRLNLLSEEANELLTTAAVVGREFPFDTLALLFHGSNDDLVSLINEGLRARVIEELEQPGRYQFTHAQMQETLLAEISTTSRVHLNARIADALEERYGDQAEARASRLARHFFEASTFSEEHADKALRYCRLAAERAEEQAGWEEAASRYDDCLAVAREARTRVQIDEAELLVAEGRCYQHANRHRDAWRALLRAVDVFRDREDWLAMARAANEALKVEAPPQRRLAVGEEALEHLAGEDRALEARLMSQMLAVPYVEARENRALFDERAARALSIAEELGLDDVRAYLLSAESFVAQDERRLDDASASQLAAIELFESIGMRIEAANRRIGAALQLQDAGRLADAEEVARDGLRLAKEMRIPYLEENHAAFVASSMLARGDYRGFRELAEEYQGAATWVFPLLATNYAIQRGDIEAARAALPRVESAGGIPGQVANLEALSARVAYLSGDLSEARARMSRMEEALAAAGGVRRGGTIAQAGEALLELATHEFKEELLSVPEGGRSIQMYALGRSPRELWGRVALDDGRIDVARRVIEEVLAWARDVGAGVIEGECQLDLAEVSSREGDVIDALSRLARAQELFREHGAPFYLERVVAKRLELQGGMSSDSQTSLVSLTTSVEEQRPDVASAVAPDGTVTLLFSDIEDSTAMNVELGDDAWMLLLGEHNRLVRDAIVASGGFEVKTEGDAFMVAFGSARDAVHCAQAMQRALDARTEEPRLRIRIGLHTGEPIREADDFYGTHVVLASRICSQANGGEILVSSLLRDLVASSGEFELTRREPVALKGLAGEHLTYEVGWT